MAKPLLPFSCMRDLLVVLMKMSIRKEIRKQAYGTTKQPNEISAVQTLEKFMRT